MTDKIVPDSLQLAAKRAFVRTTYQAYAATLTSGLIVSAVSLITDPSNLLTVAVAGVTALVTPLAAGAAAYLSFISKGLPGEYVTEAAVVIGIDDEPVG
jgi:hypothetical protein